MTTLQRARKMVKAMLDNYPRGRAYLNDDEKIDYVLSSLPLVKLLNNARTTDLICGCEIHQHCVKCDPEAFKK